VTANAEHWLGHEHDSQTHDKTIRSHSATAFIKFHTDTFIHVLIQITFIHYAFRSINCTQLQDSIIFVFSVVPKCECRGVLLQ
jgi:hypothetical protein